MARRDFDSDETISPPTVARVPYERDGIKSVASVEYTPRSLTVTKYAPFTYVNDSLEEQTTEVVVRRESAVISVLGASNPTYCKSLKENGIPVSLNVEDRKEAIVQTSYVMGQDGPRVWQEIADEYITEFALAGSLGIQNYAFSESVGGVTSVEPVVLTNRLIHSSRTFTDYYVYDFQGLTQTKTTRYLCWGLTQEGSQLAADVAQYAESPGEILSLISYMSAFVCDGTQVQTNRGRDYGLQERPTEQDEERNRYTDYINTDFTDPISNEDSIFDFGIDDDGFDPFKDSEDAFDIPESNWDFPAIDPPTDPLTGDTWIDVTTDTPYIFDRFDWVPVTSDLPIDPEIGDTWFDPSISTTTFWDGTDWVSYQPQPDTFLPPLDDAGVVSSNPAATEWSGWDGDKWVNYQDTEPVSPGEGDSYISVTGIQYTWTDDAWYANEDVVFPPRDGDPPADPAIGDSWIDPDTNTLNYWNGEQWSRDRPEGATLRSTAYIPNIIGVISTNPRDGTSSVWDGTAWVPYGAATPSPTSGALRVDPATGDELRWDGTAWVATGKTWPTKGSEPPADPVDGQQWIDDSDYRLKRWTSGGGWQQFDPAPPFNPAAGDVWVDVENDRTFIWNGFYDWVLYSEAAPTTIPAGGVYVQPSTGIEYAWDGSAWEPTGTVYGSNVQAGIEPQEIDVVKSVVVDLPFPNDDCLALDFVPGEVFNPLSDFPQFRPGYTTRSLLIPGKAREQAKTLAYLEHALRYGTTNGVNVTMPVWRLPTTPLDPFYIRAGGLEVQYLADGASWQWDGERLVVSCDGILVGATGRVAGEPLRPWVAATIPATALPAVGEVSTGIAAPANTIPTPQRFRASRPGNIWTLLPTSGSDVFEEYRTPVYVYPPFSPVERERVVTFITVQELETEYSLLPVDEGVEDVVVMITINDGEAVVLPTTVIAVTALAPVVSTSEYLITLPVTTVQVSTVAPSVTGILESLVLLPVTTITVSTVAPVITNGSLVELPLTTVQVTTVAPVVAVGPASGNFFGSWTAQNAVWTGNPVDEWWGN